MNARLRTSTAVLSMILSGMLSVPMAAANEQGMALSMAPHCTEQDRSLCPLFETENADHLKTAKLNVGDILDIDIIVKGAKFADVRTVRSWLSYDPEVLEARNVELTAELPSPTPGEQTGDPVSKVIKIGGATNSGLTNENAVIARVTFRVLRATKNSEISFFDYQLSGYGHTAINGSPSDKNGDSAGAFPEPPCIDQLVGCRESGTPLLLGDPTKLTVLLADPNSTQPEQASTETVADTENGVSETLGTVSDMGNPEYPQNPYATDAATARQSLFSLLQVQDLRVTSRDTVIFLGWQELRSSELAGYNVYYGTVSGRYIQRRSLPANATSLVLRDLEPGSTYFLAIRGVNAQTQESMFSQEVSVTVGKPETATSPLTGNVSDVTAPAGNPATANGDREVRGETGMADTILYLVLASATLGTVLAFRRQLILHRTISHVA